MKKKKSRLLAFSLLALCVACLAFGVYALKNATLTVSGTVGFTAHDCMVNVKAYIEGDGLTEAGTTATDGHPSEERALNFRNANSNEITVGGATQGDWNKTDEIKDVIYFTDLTDSGTVAPITMTFRLTNLSVYDVYARIANIDDLTEKGVSVVVSDEVVMQESNDSATDEAVLTAVFTLDTTKVTDAGLMEGFELKLDFGKNSTGNQGGEEEGGDDVGGGEEVTEKFDAPANATINDGILTFDLVDGANEYVIKFVNFNQKMYNVTTNSVDLSAYESDLVTGWTYDVYLSTLFTADKDSSDEILVGEYTVEEGIVLTQHNAPTGSKIESNGFIDIDTSNSVNAEHYQLEFTEENNITGEPDYTYVIESNNRETFVSDCVGRSGTYNIRVKALGDYETYSDSEWVDLGQYLYVAQLAVPTGSSIDPLNEYVYITEVENATHYEVRYIAEGASEASHIQIIQPADIVDNVPYTLPEVEGKYTVVIAAVDSNGIYLSGELTFENKYEVYKNADEEYKLRKVLIAEGATIDTTNKTITITRTLGAVSYKLKYSPLNFFHAIQGQSASEFTVELSLPTDSETGEIKAGTYTISLIAVGNEETTADSDERVIGTYTIDADGNITVAE